MNLTLYPPLEPFRTGFIAPAGSGHQIYFEECGNPGGEPVVVLHGGPGSGCNPGQRRFFDPTRYRIILFDQRGSGRSLPAGHTLHNTTPLLLQDIEQLRQHLDIARWTVFGGSWGSTLALAYAAQHPVPIKRLILRGIFLARQQELKWFLYDAQQFFPDAWERFTSILDQNEKQHILEAYQQRLGSADPATAMLAATAWSTYESRLMNLPPSAAPLSAANNMVSRLQVHLHYLVNHCFLSETPLLEMVDRFRHIPATLVHGRYDMVCPLYTAYELHRAWPEAELIIVDNAGHSAMEPGIISALIRATRHA